MGYLTDYKIKISPFTEDEGELFQFREIFKGSGFFKGYDTDLLPISEGKYKIEFDINGVKWYSWCADLEDLSSRYPTKLIEVEGHGEESGDIWRARIRNSESEIVHAKYTFAPFTKILEENMK